MVQAISGERPVVNLCYQFSAHSFLGVAKGAMKMKKFSLCLIFTLLLGVAPSGTNASSNDSELSESEKTFSKCIDEKRKVSVLYLVDESKSLQKSDPQNRRVDAIEGSIRAFYSMVKSSQNLKNSFSVDIKIAGFSNRYYDRSQWVRLEKGTDNFATSDKNLDTLIKSISGQRKLNTKPYTNTGVGLRKSLNELVDKKNDAKQGDCRMLIFFSDGELDLDDNPKSLNKKEQKTLSTDICGKNQIADQLRENDVFTATVGLSVAVGTNRPNLGLMELVSTGKGNYSRDRKTGGGVFSLKSCGSQPGYGAHVESTNPDDLVKNLIKFTPDAPNNHLVLGQCDDVYASDDAVLDNTKSEECRQVTFSITEVTKSFKVLITRSEPDQKVGLFSPADGSSVPDLFRGEDSTKQVSIYPLGGKSSLVEVTRSEDGNLPWTGKWSIVLRGPGVNTSTVDVKFIGGLSVRLNANDSSGKNRVNRDETKDLDLEIVSATKTPVSYPMNMVELSVFINGTNFKVEPRDLVRGIWFLSEAQVKDLITKSGVFAGAASMKIEVRPVANVEVFPSQPVKILFDPTIEEIAISNGNGYPTCVPSDVPLKLNEKENLTIFLSCSGPKQGNGIFEFKSVQIKSDFDPEFKIVTSKNDLKCRIKQNVQKSTCDISLQPGKSYNGSVEIVLIADSYGTDVDATDSRPSNVNLSLEMSRPTDTPILWIWIIVLIAIFVLVQASIRAIFAMAMSRFEALEVNYRSLVIPVTLLNPPGGMRIRRNGETLYAAESEASNVVELGQPCTQFSIDTFSFSTSWLETFLKVGSTPKGRVSSVGSYVFGSSGTSVVKNGYSVGLVNLALPSQWTIAVDADQFIAMRLGKTEDVNAKLLCILKPFESFGNGIDSQLGEVNVEILTKLSSMFSSIPIKQDEPEKSVEDTDVDSGASWSDVSDSGWDSQPKKSSRSDGLESEKKPSKRLKKEKKKKNSSSLSSDDDGTFGDSSSGWN